MRKLKYMAMSCEQNAGKNHKMKIGNKTSERVEQFKYLGKTLTSQNFIHEKSKCRLHSENACSYSGQNLCLPVIRKHSSGRVIVRLQRPLPENTQHSQQTDIDAPSGIRNYSPTTQTDLDPRLRPRCHWNRLIYRTIVFPVFS
jgi:hypothetical protein